VFKTNAGLETYPYSPWLVWVTSLLFALGPEVASKLAVMCRLHSWPRSVHLRELVVDSPPLSPMLLPPGRATPASPAPHSILSPLARLAPNVQPLVGGWYGLSFQPGSGADANSGSGIMPSPARFFLPSPAPTPPRPGLRHVPIE
jgi:hypothetical protein